MSETTYDFSGLRAMYINCTLKRSPDRSHTQGLVDVSSAIMEKHGVEVEVLRAIDHDIATGVYLDMTEHGWETDAWPEIHRRVMASDILVIAGPIWLGDNSSVTKQIIERLYAGSGELNDAGQYSYYGRAAGCLITGNEDGVKHCAMNILYSLQHLGYAIPPQADAGWIGEAGPGPSYLDMPGVALPIGADGAGLPISLLVTGPSGADDRVLAAASALSGTPGSRGRSGHRRPTPSAGCRTPGRRPRP